MADLTVIILTYNEETNIVDCIESILPIANRIIVVDSFSTDKTKEIAKRYGAEVYEHEFINQSKQYKWAMNCVNIKTKWVLRLDADERLTEKTRKELDYLLQIHSKDDINGIVLRFEISFLGKKLKHGGVYPFKKMSVYKQGFADIEDKEMDEHFYLLSGKSICMKNDCEHKDYKNIDCWIEKHNKYSSREANDFFNNVKSNDNNVDVYSKRKNKIKNNFYYKFPLFFRTKLYYWYRLYVKFAWLDGREGKIFAFLQSYWYRYLVDVKIYERQKSKK